MKKTVARKNSTSAGPPGPIWKQPRVAGGGMGAGGGVSGHTVGRHIGVSSPIRHMLTSAGHRALTPSQDSIGLHIRLREARQTMPAEITWSGGQFGEEPKQISGRSHSPTEALHSTPLRYLGRQSGEVPVH